MRKASLFVGVLAAGLMAATAQGTPFPSGLTPVVSYDFDSWGRTAGTNWADGIMWGDSGAGALAKVYSDGGNLCGQILPKTTTGSVYYGVFLNQSLLGSMATYPLNVLSFKVKMPAGYNWDNWDKAVQVKWARGGVSGSYAYGTDLGTGFSIASEAGVGKAQGSFGYGTSKVGGGYVAPGHAYHTALTNPAWKADYGSAGWTTLAMVMDRQNGMIEWYRDGVSYASYQVLVSDPNYAEWVWGSNLDPNNPRWMQWIDVGAWGRYQSTTSTILFDEFVVSGGVPEPATLLLLLGAVPMLRRRSRA